MAEIVNLKRARKARAKRNAEQEAVRNRTVHGLSRAQKERLKADKRDADKHLEQHRRGPRIEE
ncbi:DUF4169 family protein [Labrys okinawensis]|uniref:DUF4169 family protein n=1 Tax=Labrys okinawensis TaxID=346911 RepID=UPI0039BCB752